MKTIVTFDNVEYDVVHDWDNISHDLELLGYVSLDELYLSGSSVNIVDIVRTDVIDAIEQALTRIFDGG
jgi:hypothetical protein